MSAYIVGPPTIDLLVAGLSRFRVPIQSKDGQICAWQNPQAAAQELLRENYRSVNERYQEDKPVPVHVFTIDTDKVGFTSSRQLVALMGCIKCFDYQACETGDWENTPVCKALEALVNAIASRFCELSGKEMPWGIETKKDLLALVSAKTNNKPKDKQ